MYTDVVGTARAAEILGVGRPRIIQMIHDRTITTAYMGVADGFTGRPGYKISVQELYELRDKREKEKTDSKSKKNVESTYDREAIVNALSELQVCLGMLADTIEKLKEGL